ncbi:hypothetical protein [Polyangium mundeleinium]|uniref:Uncharacterized protein n=1 Tax=Polyangium mundeleinium TaxID=2995306 RepID=A0ABT5EP80_9BACT|nr:hypothetical protein [Polyangium mundeleinium]MDC0742570.1 hypothetical protein [Polyangium mundeleinium]
MRNFIRFGVLLVFAGMGAGVGFLGCGENGNLADCPREVAYDPYCCPCPLPEACPDPDFPGYNKPKPIPWECPNACDGPPPRPPRCSDGGADGGEEDGGMSLCADGVCVPESPEDWRHAAFFSDWREPPPCPGNMPIVAFEGTPAPPPLLCGECSCDEPEGTCTLPQTWTVDSQACPGGGVKTNFDPSVGWDGTCNQEKAILSSTLCGGVPCVRSITISPPVIEEQPCKAHVKGDPVEPPAKFWNGGPETPLGRVCTSAEPWPSCAGQSGKVCGPAGDDYASCIFKEGEHLCPEGWTGERHVLYGVVKDKRECSTCTCGPSTGGTCAVLWSAFGAPACTDYQTGGQVTAGMTAPCNDVMPGAPLSGKTAELLNYTKGTCIPSGGEVVGELSLDKPITVCCPAVTT